MDAAALAALELPAIIDRLAGLTATEHGATLARELEPSFDDGVVAGRQALTSAAVALHDGNAAPELAGIRDVRAAAERAGRGGLLRCGELRGIATSIRVALEAKRVVSDPLLAALLEPVDPTLATLADEVDLRVAEDGTDLRDDASPLLRRLRAELRNGVARVRDELARVARSAEVKDALQESFLAERGGRPVLAVRASARGKVPGVVHDASTSGQTLFVEPFAVVELNNRLAEAAADARDEAERILHELSSAVSTRAGELHALVESTGALDLALACGALSRAWHGAPVEISKEVRLLGARHPLLAPATAVPIDLELGSLRALVISGPNTGGKTVALKTIGLAALLHQSGLRPPAQAASLPVFDQVLADIGDRQSIEMSLSTFSGHLRTLVAVLDCATDRSLVLLDEVAAGTDPEEGSALAQALVARLARQARLTVVTTHYGELKEWASATVGVANAATGFDPETDEPLYRVALGRPGVSHALRIAERLGLDGELAADARSRIAPERLRVAELLAEAERAEREAVSLRSELADSLGSVRVRAVELERELESVRASAERVRRAAVADAERELAGVRAELRSVRDELRDARRQSSESDQDRLLGSAVEHATRAERALRELAGPLPLTAPLAEGDPVEAPDVGVRGTIASIRGGEAEVVGAAGQRVRIPLSRLRPARERVTEEHTPAVSVRTAARSDVSDQIDVRGHSGQEAREHVRRLVDDAVLAGLHEVRVVHGRGTGALRRAVREELATHPLVEASEPDADDGATIVKLG